MSIESASDMLGFEWLKGTKRVQRVVLNVPVTDSHETILVKTEIEVTSYGLRDRVVVFNAEGLYGILLMPWETWSSEWRHAIYHEVRKRYYADTLADYRIDRMPTVTR